MKAGLQFTAVFAKMPPNRFFGGILTKGGDKDARYKGSSE
jgi:hypothetical protein